MNLRFGAVVYMNVGIGAFQTPQVPKYQGQFDDSAFSLDNGVRRTVIDATRATNGFLEIGPGVAIWPSQQLSIRLEGGGTIGFVDAPENRFLSAGGSTDFVVGAFFGPGVSYRLPKSPIALSLNYRLQWIRYRGFFGSGLSSDLDGVNIAYEPAGWVHSLGLGLIVRFDHGKAH